MHRIHHISAFYTNPERKSTKCHDLSNLNLNDLEWHLGQ